MAHHCPGKLVDFRAPAENNDIFSLFEDDRIHDFCPRLASTPQQDMAVSSQNSPLYHNLANLSYSHSPITSSPACSSLPSYSQLSTPSHRDLLDVIEATEQATVPSPQNLFTFGSAPMPRDTFRHHMSLGTRYAQTAIPNIHLPSTSSSPFKDPRYIYPRRFGVIAFPSPTAVKVEHRPELGSPSNPTLTNVRHVRPSNVCTEGFVIPSAQGNSVSVWSQEVPKMQPLQSSPMSKFGGHPMTMNRTPRSVSPPDANPGGILSSLKHMHKSSKSGTRKKSHTENRGHQRVLPWMKSSFLEPLNFETNFENHGMEEMRRPLSEVQSLGANNMHDQNFQLHSSLHQLQMLSLRDLERKSPSVTSDDSGLSSQPTYSQESEIFKSRDKSSSSSGEFTPEYCLRPPKDFLYAKERKKQQNEKPNKKFKNKLEALSPAKVVPKEEISPHVEENILVTSPEASGFSPEGLCSPAKRGAKVQRKPVTPKRSASPGDPMFRGVTLQMRTTVETNDQVQLSIKAFFNCRKANRLGTRRSPAKKSLRDDSTSSSDSDLGVELFPEKKRRTHTIGKQCASCATKTTPLWRDAEDGTPLCNACGIRYKKYRVRCSRCWHIPRKETKANLECHNCGEPLKYTIFKAKQWKN